MVNMAEHRFIVPRPDDEEDLFEMLIGRKVTAKRQVDQPAPTGLGVVGVYVDDELEPAVLVYADFKLVIGAGGALSMVPVGAVEDAIDEKEIPKNLFDNFSEILNVSSSLFNDKRHNAKRVKLGSAHLFPEDTPDQVKANLIPGSEQTTLDVQLTIAGGYGGGRFLAVLL